MPGGMQHILKDIVTWNYNWRKKMIARDVWINIATYKIYVLMVHNYILSIPEPYIAANNPSLLVVDQWFKIHYEHP